jgi:hypothetical protein
MNKRSNCIVCGAELRGRQTKYCSIRCKNKALQSYPAQQQRGLDRKLQLVRTRGGCCSRCGYNKNLAALIFHHKGSDKAFKLDMRSLSNRTWNAVLAEAEKCVLLCRNCHAELHNPKLDLALLSNASHYDFHRPFRVCGLDCPFTLITVEGACRPVSTPSRPCGLGSGLPYHHR